MSTRSDPSSGPGAVRDGAEATGPAVLSSFFPLPVESLEAAGLELDLYLLNRSVPTLYRSAGSSHTVRDLTNLRDQGVEFVYVPLVQHERLRRALMERSNDAFADDALSHLERARIIRQACQQMVEDFMRFPDTPGIDEGVTSFATMLASWQLADEDKFAYLLEMGEHHFATAAHCVNVSVGCVMLAAHMGIDDQDVLMAYAFGGLVHDIGKRSIPANLLNKEGRLSEEEWQTIRAHPELGLELIGPRPGVGPVVTEIIGGHHERLDGSGYPRGLAGDDLGRPARIGAVVDVYDSISTARAHRPAISPPRTLDLMSQGRGSLYDEEVFDAWRGMVRLLVKRDAGRAPARTRFEEQISLSMVLQYPPDGGPGDDDVEASGREIPEFDENDRRVRVQAQGRFIARSSGGLETPPERFDVEITAIRDSFLQLSIPFQAGQDDVLSLTLPRGIESRVHVHRAHIASQGRWRLVGEVLSVDRGPEGAAPDQHATSGRSREPGEAA